MEVGREQSASRAPRTIHGWRDPRRGIGIVISFGLALGLLAVAAPAGAAQIDLTSCQPQQVRICALDPAGHDLNGEPMWNITGDHIYSEGETKHFTCDANCKFWISEHCSDGSCSSCLNKGSFVDHSWGKGAYQLISLEKNGSGDYKSADLQQVDSGAPCP